MNEPTTKAGKLLLMAGLTFHSGRRLADHPAPIIDIEDAARSELLRSLRDQVKALPELTLFEQGDGPHLDRSAVLALLADTGAAE